MVDVASSMRVYCAQRARFSAKLSTEKLWIFPTFQIHTYAWRFSFTNRNMVLVGSKLQAPLPASPLACKILCCWRREGIWNKASPCVMFQNHSELQQTQKSKGENLLRLVKRHGKTTQLFFFFTVAHFSLFIFTPYGVCRMLGEVGRVGAREGRSGGGMTKRHERTKANKQTE